MNSFNYCVPTRVIFGKDALDELKSALKPFSPQKVLVLYGSGSVVRNGILKDVTDALSSAGISYVEKGGVKANPMLSFANETKKFALEQGIDFILAVGGGSTIDTAKSVAFGMKKPECDIWDFYCGKEKIIGSVPVGTVLTISAAGSETSDSSVLTNDQTQLKRGANSFYNRPVFSILNPQYTTTLPKYQVACGVVDILMHTFDRYFAANTNNELTNQIAEGVIRTTLMYGKTAYENPQDYTAMSELMWSGSISHNGITGLGATPDFCPHKLGHSLSGIYDVAHGATLSTTWNGFANFVSKRKPENFVRFAKNVWGITEGTDAEIAQAGIDKTVAYFKSLNMPTTFVEMLDRKLTDDEIEVLLDACHGVYGDLGSYSPLSREDMKEIYTWLNK